MDLKEHGHQIPEPGHAGPTQGDDDHVFVQAVPELHHFAVGGFPKTWSYHLLKCHGDQELVNQTEKICCTEWQTDLAEADATSGKSPERLREEITIWFR